MRAPWSDIELDKGKAHPLCLSDQLAGQMLALIASGRLLSGSEVPGFIEMAEYLQITEETVLLAYRILHQRGHIKTFQVESGCHLKVYGQITSVEEEESAYLRVIREKIDGHYRKKITASHQQQRSVS